MSPETLFQIHLVLGYVAWLLCFGAYVWPRLKAMDRVEAQRAIATLHSFRFFGLVFILPGVVGPNLPAGFAAFAAYGDFATGVLAMLALLTVRIRPLFWLFVVAFNLVGTVDLIVDYYHAIQARPSRARGGVGRHLRDPDHLCAAADDHARRRVLFAGASSAQDGSGHRRRRGRNLDRAIVESRGGGYGIEIIRQRQAVAFKQTSASGHEQTRRPFVGTSAFLPKADPLESSSPPAA